MLTNEDHQGVSNCYVFKSRLQEYAQKVGLPTPVYETIKEGPSHQPSFRSTVIVNNVRYDSLPGFFNRKAAEQSAAEIALVELAKSDEINQSITQPVIETGLCKNLLQEYAQKMNYAMPLYLCKKDERPGRSSSYSCTVEIGGIRYIGASARTKKEAEIKAARTALLAIESRASQSSEKQFGHSKLTVVPCKKRGAEAIGKADETSKVPKTKKARFKRKPPRKKQSGDKKGRNHIESAKVESRTNVNDESCVQALESRTLAANAANFDNGGSVDYQNENGLSSREGLLSLNSSKVLENGESMKMQSDDSCIQTMKWPLAPCAMNSNKGMLAGDDSVSLNGNKVCGNGNSTELASIDFSFQVMESGTGPADAIKSMDTGMSISNRNEKDLLAGEDSVSHNNNSIFADDKSNELLSNKHYVQTMESIPEAMKNLDDGMSLDYQNDKGILAVEGSLSLDSSNIFENRESTELQSSESCLPIVDSGTLAAETKKNDVGMSVNDRNEMGSLAEEGSVSLNNNEIFENGSTNLKADENNLGAGAGQIFVSSNGETQEK
ncbi:hypothetical protein QN277_014999 [Acacia crassicarpa]|uniref:DRBM domain-containing protein n=1 Tax=Acacia crassicarpa TaxID=499986 RepID=A0AAE1JWH4_9FABA|nr:hypothetical protein QN277_014999 [Acacia crassicarpa]